MKRKHNVFTDSALTLAFVALFVVLCFVIDKIFVMPKMTPAIMTLGVFLVSLSTEGYFYGIAASLLSVLALNFVFTFPYFKFNFTIWENLVSAVIMLIVTILSSALATKVIRQEKFKAETEKERMRANLLRAVSHDLRTPLTTIYGSSSTIAEKIDVLSNEQILKLAEGIREDSDWLMRMVENLLSITKVDSTGVDLKTTNTVLEELIDAVLVKFKKRYPKQSIEIDIPDEFVIIPMDAMLIEQVIINMLENAVHHAKGMTKLILKVFTVEDSAIFEIIDDGCGISKDQLDTVFKGFFEKKETHVDNQKSSMGIGLSVCASIIKAHNGKISVENRKSGGCTFRFILKMETEGNE